MGFCHRRRGFWRFPGLAWIGDFRLPFLLFGFHSESGWPMPGRQTAQSVIQFAGLYVGQRTADHFGRIKGYEEVLVLSLLSGRIADLCQECDSDHYLAGRNYLFSYRTGPGSFEYLQGQHCASGHNCPELKQYRFARVPRSFWRLRYARRLFEYSAG